MTLAGNGLDRGWDFLGFGNSELQCFTSDKSNVDVVPDPTNSTNSVLRLQAKYHPTAIPCTDQDPYKQATTQWTSGRIRTMSKRIFQAPQNRLPNTTATGELHRAAFDLMNAYLGEMMSGLSSAANKVECVLTSCYPLCSASAADNCTSLFIEARMRLPAVKGNRAGLLLLPEPQNQTMGAPRCDWTDECGAYGAWPVSEHMHVRFAGPV